MWCDTLQHSILLFCNSHSLCYICVCVVLLGDQKKKTKTCIYFSWTKIYLLACFNILTVFFIAMHSAQALLLGFQHYILTLGMTVLIPTVIVPEMGGGHVNNFFLPIFDWEFFFFFSFCFPPIINRGFSLFIFFLKHIHNLTVNEASFFWRSFCSFFRG